MIASRSLRTLVCLLCLTLPLLACQKEKAPAAAGRITATAAYTEHFGPPPAVEEGSAFAMVGYLPLAESPAKVAPMPLFLFSEEMRMQRLLERLLSVDTAATERIGVINPFPSGTLLLSVQQIDDLVQVDLQIPSLGPEVWQQIYASLGQSLLQFPGVARVVVTASGELPEGYGGQGERPDPATVASPGEPKLLGVVGVWEPGQEFPQEISVFFDRPVTVQQFQLSEHGGNAIEGDYNRSVFDMAVVILPKQPVMLSEGMAVTAVWDVTDKLGRPGKGEKTLTLMRIEHP